METDRRLNCLSARTLSSQRRLILRTPVFSAVSIAFRRGLFRVFLGYSLGMGQMAGLNCLSARTLSSLKKAVKPCQTKNASQLPFGADSFESHAMDRDKRSQRQVSIAFRRGLFRVPERLFELCDMDSQVSIAFRRGLFRVYPNLVKQLTSLEIVSIAFRRGLFRVFKK